MKEAHMSSSSHSDAQFGVDDWLTKPHSGNTQSHLNEFVDTTFHFFWDHLAEKGNDSVIHTDGLNNKTAMTVSDKLAVILFGLSEKFGANLVFKSRHVSTAEDAATTAVESPYPSMVAYNSAGGVEQFDYWAVVCDSKCIAKFKRHQALEAHVVQFAALYNFGFVLYCIFASS